MRPTRSSQKVAGVGATLQGVAINPAGARVYYTDTDNANVYGVDTATNTAIATVPVGSSPEGLDVTPEGSRVYGNWMPGAPRSACRAGATH